jgi:hypothetical protein
LLLLDVDALADGTVYRVEKESSCGDVTSSTATLFVNDLPTIVDENLEIFSCEGNDDFFFIEANNTTSIQWQILMALILSI